MFTSRCENATQQRHCCSRPTVVIARPAVRLAAAPCFLKPQGPCGHGPWVSGPAGGRRRRWRRGIDADLLAALSTFGRAIGKGVCDRTSAAPHSQTRWQPRRHCWQSSFQACSPSPPGIARHRQAPSFDGSDLPVASAAPAFRCVSGSNTVDQSELPYSGLGAFSPRAYLFPPRSLAKQGCATLFIFTSTRLTQPD